MRARCIGGGGGCDTVLGWGSCGLGLCASGGPRVGGGGSGLKKDTSIPESLSSSSTFIHREVIGRSQSVSVSVRSMTSCIGLSPSTGALGLQAMAGCGFDAVDARTGSWGAEAEAGLGFRERLGSEGGVDFPDAISLRGPRLAVLARARPWDSKREEDADVLDGPAGQIADALEVFVRG